MPLISSYFKSAFSYFFWSFSNWSPKWSTLVWYGILLLTNILDVTTPFSFRSAAWRSGHVGTVW
jgi:hypothetical protein